MKILYIFPKKFLYFSDPIFLFLFCDPSFYASVQKFGMLDYVIL